MIRPSSRFACHALLASALSLLAGCPEVEGVDGGPSADALFVEDAGVGDASASDAAGDAGLDAASDAGPPTAIFVAPRDGDDPSTFFDLPWPSEARLTARGAPDLSSFPAPSRGIVRAYVEAIEREQRGFSTLGSVYFRFNVDVDPASLPGSLRESVSPDASVLLVPLVPGASHLEPHPIVTRFEPRRTRYWPGETLAIRPADGFPLLPGTLYAAVVTRAVRPAAGGSFRRDVDLEALLARDASVARLGALYEPALEALETLGIARDTILSIAVFRTQDPTALLAASVAWVHDALPTPVVVADAWRARGSTATYNVVQGRYRGAPTFQEGVSPYATTGGAIHLDEEGHPILVGTFEARFALSVPTSPMPDAGYPIVLYGHGTGGDFRSFLDDDTAGLVAAAGFAAIGIDAPIHGERAEHPDGTLFFNVANPDAVRSNPLQAALDHAAEVLAVTTMEVPIGLLERDGRAVHFDPSRIYYIGHSQGALVGPLFFGVDASARAALFSEGGSLIGYTMREKTEPVDIPALVRSLLGLPGANTADAFEREGFTLEHPVITLLQGWIDVSDPGNYAAFAAVRPLPTVGPRSVALTEGLRDPYVSPAGMEALATAYRVPVLAPVARELAGLEFLGIRSELGDAHANLPGGATGGLFQFPEEGHFGFFNVEPARERIGAFFASLLDDGVGTIPGP